MPHMPAMATAHDSGADGRIVTGDEAIDQALAQLTDLASLPVREHVAVLDAVHQALQDRLVDAEQ